MNFDLNTETINKIDTMLSNGMRLRTIAKKLRISESTLRWRIAKAGLATEYTGHLVPIHAPEISSETAA